MITIGSQLAQQRLRQLSRQFEDTREYKGQDGRVRHKCFLSYHVEDAEAVEAFVQAYDSVFIPKVIGISDDSPFINSVNVDYIMDCVREQYLTDSTVTIVFVGQCTWARKFVDWEVYSSLRAGKNNQRNGLMAIELPGSATNRRLPARLSDNVLRDSKDNNIGYARYWAYPSYPATLQNWIEDAFDARSSRANLINNSRTRATANQAC